MSTHEHTPDELEHALRVIRSECRAHPESCTECPLSFNDGDRFAGAASQTDFLRRQNGTFRRRSVGRRLPMRQGGRIHDNQRSSWNYWR